MSLDISTINPYIRVAMQSVFHPGTEIKRRIIFDYELIYIEYGQFVLNYNEIDYLCTEGQFVLLRPGVPHSFSQIHSDLSQPHIHFDITHTEDSTRIPVSFQDIDKFTEDEKKRIREDIFHAYPKTPFVTFADKEKVLPLFFEIVSDAGISMLDRKAKLIQLIDMLIVHNFPDILKISESPYTIESHVKDYIDAGQGTTAHLDEIAKQFNYSKYHLERRFKEHYGISLIAYRNNRRMQLAKKLLKTESVSSVSEELRFSSIYVFSRAFKQHFGISPTEYKKSDGRH